MADNTTADGPRSQPATPTPAAPTPAAPTTPPTIAAPTTTAAATTQECAICLDEFDEGQGVGPICHNRHAWCGACVRASVAAAVNNVSDAACMPPRCCGDGVLPTEGGASGDDGGGELWRADEHPVLRLLDGSGRAAWREALRRWRAVADVRSMYVDRSVVRTAMNSRGQNLFQFCQRCYRLVMRSQGCNHMTCLCGYHFCILCAGEWPTVPWEHDGEPPPLCHPYFGQDNKHVLRIPDAVQAHLDAEEEKPPPALADDAAQGLLCGHDEDMLYKLRLRRELNSEELGHARCEVCGRMFRAFLLQCRGCSTLMCLACRDRLWAGWQEQHALEDQLEALSLG